MIRMVVEQNEIRLEFKNQCVNICKHMVDFVSSSEFVMVELSQEGFAVRFQNRIAEEFRETGVLNVEKHIKTIKGWQLWDLTNQTGMEKELQMFFVALCETLKCAPEVRLQRMHELTTEYGWSVPAHAASSDGETYVDTRQYAMTMEEVLNREFC